MGLIAKSLIIMRRIAIKTGNPESTRDMYKILKIFLIITIALLIAVVSFIVLAVLRSYNVYPFGQGLEQRTAWTQLFDTIRDVLLFTGDIMLINLFWNYVININ